MKNITITFSLNEVEHTLKVQATCQNLEKHDVIYFIDELKAKISVVEDAHKT